MSHNKFVSLPVLQLNRSKILLFLIVCLHLLALFCVTYSVYFHISVNVFLGLFVVISFAYYILYYQNLSRLTAIKYRADGMWVFGFKDKPLLVSLEPDYLLTDWLIILRFKVGMLKTRSIPIFKDMLTPKDFKQLRVVLPYLL